VTAGSQAGSSVPQLQAGAAFCMCSIKLVCLCWLCVSLRASEQQRCQQHLHHHCLQQRQQRMQQQEMQACMQLIIRNVAQSFAQLSRACALQQRDKQQMPAPHQALCLLHYCSTSSSAYQQ
jgi:hypothetical protein